MHRADTTLHVHCAITDECIWTSLAFFSEAVIVEPKTDLGVHFFSVHFVIPAHHKGSIALNVENLFLVFHLPLSITNNNNELLLAAECLDCRCMRLVLLLQSVPSFFQSSYHLNQEGSRSSIHKSYW